MPLHSVAFESFHLVILSQHWQRVTLSSCRGAKQAQQEAQRKTKELQRLAAELKEHEQKLSELQAAHDAAVK